MTFQVPEIESFATRRRAGQDAAIDALRPVVVQWLTEPGDTTDIAEYLSLLYVDTYLADGGKRRARTAAFLASLKKLMDETKSDSDPAMVTTWLAVATINAAGLQAASDDPRPTLLVWTTMHDNKVRHAHVAADGQRRPPGSVYLVGGQSLRYPGDPRGRLDNVANCRCVLTPVYVGTPRPIEEDSSQAVIQAAAKETTMLDEPLAWHGVLAPEDEWSGDGRRFAAGSLRTRDLPLPLTWQRASGEGHDGSTVVAKITSIERVGNLMRAEGTFIDTPETDEVVGLIAEFGKFGVSIDADDSEFEFDEESQRVTFTSARIASASLVSIPAFASAFVALGTWAQNEEGVPKEDQNAEECDPESPDYEECMARKEKDRGPGTPGGWEPVAPGNGGNEVPMHASLGTEGVVEMISDAAWDGSAGRFTPEQWKASCILHVCDGDEKSCHKLPIKEPGGALSRAGVHAAASRFGQVDAPEEEKAKAARALRGAYKQLGEEPPDAIKASLEAVEFARGPGWITNPEDTRRLWAYWTQPGHEGYAKVKWGVPGDFNRCRVMVGEEIGESSPEKLRFLNQICAQWHHDATGFWPGRAPTEQSAVPISGDLKTAPAVTLVASAAERAPASWFADPKLTGPTHLTVTEEGRVFGHIAEWSSCHIGYPGVCVAPPQSASGYAHFATGKVMLDDGTFARTGVISLGGGHAGPRESSRAAAAHYDSTSAAVADVAVGEDEHGIWCAGWIRPGTDQNRVIALRASDISGDWREVGGSMELVAALAVNVAGFPVVSVHDRNQVTLVAAGVVEQPDEPMSALVNAVVAAMARRDRMAKLRERVGV